MGIDLNAFASLVGDANAGSVWVQGRGTRVPPPPNVRIIDAPIGISEFQPDEMTVICGAGTTIAELVHELGAHGQYVNLPDSASGSGTVGGALARGFGDIYRLGRGNIRDTLLQARFVDYQGRVITAGGPTVKNVSGFDVCRLLVGSQGLLGFIGEVILRTRPIAPATRWFTLSPTHFSVSDIILQNTYRPASVLSDGSTIWLCLEGHIDDIADTLHHLGTLGIGLLIEGAAPDLTAFPHRHSMAPRLLSTLLAEAASRGEAQQQIVEAGVGVIHSSIPLPVRDIDSTVEVIHQRLLQRFNPDGRLNPGATYLV